MRGDGFQKMAHLELQGVCLDGGLHAALFDHPELQRRRPGRDAEDRGDIAAADGVLDISLGAMGAALKPALVAHARGIAENDRGGHQYSTAFARSYSFQLSVKALAMFSSRAKSLLSGAPEVFTMKGISCMARNTSWAVAAPPP